MVITEKQIKNIVNNVIHLFLENEINDGFSFGTMGRGSDRTFRFTPMKNDTNTDTRIFDDNGNFKVNKILLPKSNIMSYNLYKIASMDVSKALKHPEQINNNIDQQSIDSFMRRTALYIKHILGNTPVDIITSPQSSSQFNAQMISYLLRLYPNSKGIKFLPNMLSKNVRNVYVNTTIAKSIGLSDNEIMQLQNRVDKWKKDEDIRDLRRKIKSLEDEVVAVKRTRGRGRPSKDFTNKVDLLNTYRTELPLLRKGLRGRDATIDKGGNVKDFQIKMVGDRERRSLEGLFQINPVYQGIQQKLKGKTIILFDDNISSGATLDDICLELQKYGVANIIPITLALIPKTIYGAHERLN